MKTKLVITVALAAWSLVVDDTALRLLIGVVFFIVIGMDGEYL